MPRSYTTDEIVERFVDLMSASPGTVPSARRLGAALALSPSALYRYFPSMAALEDAACQVAIERLLSIADERAADRHPLVACAAERPGLLWAITRLDSDRPPIDDRIAVRLTSLERERSIIRTAALSVVGVLWRLRRDAGAWAAEIERVLPPAIQLFRRAADVEEHPPPSPAWPDLLLEPPVVDDPIVSTVLDQVWSESVAPSLRGVARRLATPRTTAFRRLTAEQVADLVRDAIYRRAESQLDRAEPQDAVTRILWIWLPAVDVFFERPALVDVFTRGSVDGNPHRTRMRAVWTELEVGPPEGLQHDDLTDILAGFVMYCARRRAASRDDVRRMIHGVARVLVGTSATSGDATPNG